MMTFEGTYKAGEELMLNADENRELIILTGVAFHDRGGVDIGPKETTTTANVNSNCARETSQPAPVNRSSSYTKANGGNHHTHQSNMITSGEHIKSNMNVILATCSANLASVASGCILSWSSPTLPKILSYGEKIHVSKEEGAWLSSLIALGAVFGPYMAGAVIDKIGRKWTIIADMLLYLISWSLLACCNMVYFLYAARILAGLGLGVVFTAVPMFIAEISPLSSRGTLGSLLQLFLYVGLLIGYVVGPHTSYLTLIVVSGVVPFLCIIAVLWVPESPQHLLNKGRKQEALDSLLWYRGYPERSLLHSEITDMLASAEEAKHSRGSIGALFTSKGYLKAFYYGCALVFFQQMSGINVILFYAESIFKTTGSQLSSSISTIIIGMVLLITAAFAAPASRIFGIRKLMLFSAVGEAASIAALAFYFFLKDSRYDVSSIYWLPVASLVCFIIVYTIAFGPFVWVILAEIFPTHLKALASSIATSFCWLMCFLLTRYFDAVTVSLGNAFAFGVFSVVCFVAFLFVLVQLPDTEGKSYQEIQEMLTGKRTQIFQTSKRDHVFSEFQKV